MLRTLVSAIALALAVAAAPAVAQTSEGDRPQSNFGIEIAASWPQDASVFDFSYEAPSSPALALLGVGGDQIARTDSVQKFGLALAQGLNDSAQSVAASLDVSPFWALARRGYSLEQYRRLSFGELAFARSKASIAVSEGDDGKNIPSSIVFSISTGFLRSQDPLLDESEETGFDACARRNIDPIIERIEDQIRRRIQRLPPEQVEAASDTAKAEIFNEERAALTEAYEACARRVVEAHEWRQALDAGVGLRLAGSEGSLSGLEDSGLIVWGTYATGAIFGKDRESARNVERLVEALQLPRLRGVIHARYTWSERLYDDSGTFLGEADTGMVVAGIEGGGEKYRMSVQAGWNLEKEIPGIRDEVEFERYLLRGDFEVYEGVWLAGALGRVEGRNTNDETYATLGVRFSAPGGNSGISEFYRQRVQPLKPK